MIIGHEETPMRGQARPIATLADALAVAVALGAVAQVTPDPVLSPGAVQADPALRPDQMNPAPVLSPGAVRPDPALSPDQTNPAPVLMPVPSDSLAPLPPIYPGRN
jgi:hypothetical protein